MRRSDGFLPSGHAADVQLYHGNQNVRLGAVLSDSGFLARAGDFSYREKEALGGIFYLCGLCGLLPLLRGCLSLLPVCCAGGSAFVEKKVFPAENAGSMVSVRSAFRSRLPALASERRQPGGLGKGGLLDPAAYLKLLRRLCEVRPEALHRLSDPGLCTGGSAVCLPVSASGQGFPESKKGGTGMGRSGIRLLWNLGACGNGFVWNCGILPDASCFCLPVYAARTGRLLVLLRVFCHEKNAGSERRTEIVLEDPSAGASDWRGTGGLPFLRAGRADEEGADGADAAGL